MSARKPWALFLYYCKFSVIAFNVALVGMSTFLATSVHAAGPSGQSRKHVGAELIVKGQVIHLTPISSSRAFVQAVPNVREFCVFVYPRETNISNDGTYAYFRYSLRVSNSCISASVTSGTWNAMGAIQCNGTWYSNPPSNAGNLSQIAAGKSVLVQDQVPYAAVCIDSFAGIIPILYPPQSISITSYTSGFLSDKNNFYDSQQDTF